MAQRSRGTRFGRGSEAFLTSMRAGICHCAVDCDVIVCYPIRDAHSKTRVSAPPGNRFAMSQLPWSGHAPFNSVARARSRLHAPYSPWRDRALILPEPLPVKKRQNKKRSLTNQGGVRGRQSGQYSCRQRCGEEGGGSLAQHSPWAAAIQ
jgi:hypothetical protein